VLALLPPILCRLWTEIGGFFSLIFFEKISAGKISGYCCFNRHGDRSTLNMKEEIRAI
jgi:hypothetical protein